MQHFKTISEYCNAIGITPPSHPHFDVRRLEDNKYDLKTKMLPFRHEFYFIAIRTEGQGKVQSGHNTQFPDGVTIYFNTPFQIQSWDVDKEWSGYYLIFSQDFLSSSHYFDRVLDNFPFLKIEDSAPFSINQEDLPLVLDIYNKIKQEYSSENDDKFDFIEIYVLELLNQIKRLFKKNTDVKTVQEKIQKADIKLLARFQELIKQSFCCESDLDIIENPHSPSDYAQVLNVHPNHLNAVIKSITGKTALNHIHNHILQLAKADLAQTNISSKEIAYKLHFSSPAKFSAFFKKYTDLAPLSYRKNTKL